MSGRGTATDTRPIRVEELKRAWLAVQNGAFRDPAPAPNANLGAAPPGSAWTPAEAVLPVVGCVAQSGATTLALALATAADHARLIECCTVTASGLSAATTAEMGTTEARWITGRRDSVTVARRGAVHLSASELPAPEPATDDTALTVLDAGWEIGQLLVSPGWLSAEVRDAATVVAVTTATVPGMRRLEIALELLGADRTVVAVLGAPPRRWARAVTAAIGPLTVGLVRDGRLVDVPPLKNLAERGIDAARLPEPLLHAAQTVLRHTDVGTRHMEGQP